MGQGMSEHKAAGVDRPSPGPCERVSEELLPLHNETSKD